MVCDFPGIYRRDLANIIARILFPGVLNLQRVAVRELHPRVGRHFHVARGQDGDATFPRQDVGRCGGGGEEEKWLVSHFSDYYSNWRY